MSRLPALIPLFLWFVTFISGLSMLCAALNVKYRDVNFIIQAFLPFWFYATPIIYTLELLPEPLKTIAYINPLTGIIELFHWVLLAVPVSSIPGLIFSIFFSLIIMISGIVYFYKVSPYFDDWV